MLAYVFWHWPDPQTDDAVYSSALCNFHRTLAIHRPEGFLFSRCLQLSHASWLGRQGTTYEDWSLVENSAALDSLNRGAVSGACLEPHNQVARWTVGSGAGLYTLRAGNASLTHVAQAYRFNKPAGMSYMDLYAQLLPVVEQSGGSLWTRQMNLGPGPEFCLLTPASLALPQDLDVLTISVQQLWSGA